MMIILTDKNSKKLIVEIKKKKTSLKSIEKWKQFL